MDGKVRIKPNLDNLLTMRTNRRSGTVLKTGGAGDGPAVFNRRRPGNAGFTDLPFETYQLSPTIRPNESAWQIHPTPMRADGEERTFTPLPGWAECLTSGACILSPVTNPRGTYNNAFYKFAASKANSYILANCVVNHFSW